MLYKNIDSGMGELYDVVKRKRMKGVKKKK
jgi:hypothetical protein